MYTVIFADFHAMIVTNYTPHTDTLIIAYGGSCYVDIVQNIYPEGMLDFNLVSYRMAGT